MGLVSNDPLSRRVIGYCDTCDIVLLPSDRHTPRSFRASPPSDLQGLFRARDDVVAIAQDAQWVASAEGKWSCSRCRSNSAPPLAEAAADGNRLRGLAILIAEDHPDSREMLSEHLASFGATCVVSSSSSEAFDAFTRQPPHILLSDLWMPDGDGFELIRRIRALSPERGGLTPAIALSAGANQEQALMAGYHALLLKPYDPESVGEIVEEFLRPADEAPSLETSWTVVCDTPGTVVLSFVGYVRASDARAAMGALVGYLDRPSCEVVVDLRRVTGFSPAGASVAERAVWAKRQAIRHVHITGGPTFARVVASAACRMLGLGCTVESGAR